MLILYLRSANESLNISGKEYKLHEFVGDTMMVCICSAQGVAPLGGVALLEEVCHCGCGL